MSAHSKELFFKENSTEFFEKKRDEIKKLVQDKDYTYKFIEGFEKELDNRYKALADRVLRPLLQIKNEKEPKIDIYKILSCIEYSVMSFLPVEISVKEDKSDEDYTIELLLNANFAFFCAYNFLAQWQSGEYDKIFSKSELLKLLDTTEGTTERQYSMTKIEEHVHILAFTSNSPILPILTNSIWWRMLCALGERLNNK